MFNSSSFWILLCPYRRAVWLGICCLGSLRKGLFRILDDFPRILFYRPLSNEWICSSYGYLSPKTKPIVLPSIYESTGSRFQAEWLTSVNNGYEILDVQIVHSAGLEISLRVPSFYFSTTKLVRNLLVISFWCLVLSPDMSVILFGNLFLQWSIPWMFDI